MFHSPLLICILKDSRTLFLKPQSLISLLEMVVYTHQPIWADCQQLLERIRQEAQKLVLGEDRKPASDPALVEKAFFLGNQIGSHYKVRSLLTPFATLCWEVTWLPLSTLQICLNKVGQVVRVQLSPVCFSGLPSGSLSDLHSD